MNSFLAWVGGKLALRDEILSRFPLAYGRYVEVFGGAAWILFHKEPDRFEVYNDYNSNLANLFRCVREDEERLIRELDWSLDSREDFYILLKLHSPKVAECDYKAAANFYKLIRYSYGNKLTSFDCKPNGIERHFPTIRAAHTRLCDVLVENKDFEALIRHYDEPGALLYCDPPYYGTEKLYLHVNFSRENHIRLHGALCGIQGNFLLSYNDDPFIRELYRDFAIEEMTRPHNLSLRYGAGTEYKELIIANFDMGERRRCHEQLSLL